MAKCTLFSTLIISLLVSTACAMNHNADAKREDESRFRQLEGQELVEITIRLPDGRVVKRMEPRIASKRYPESMGIDVSSPPIVHPSTNNPQHKTLHHTQNGVSGGTNASSFKLSGGSGGGGSSTSPRGGGGGGGDNSNSQNSGHSGNGGEIGNSGSTWEVDNSILLDPDKRVWLYAWKNSGAPFEHLTLTIEVNPRNKGPRLLAQRTAEQVQTTQPERVVLRFKDEFIPAIRDPFDPADASELLNAGGFKQGLTEYWTEFALELRALGVVPDLVIMDQEEGIEFSRIDNQRREDFFNEMIHSPSLIVPDAPVLMRNLTYNQFRTLQSHESRAARYEHHAFALKFRSRFLRDVFMEALNSAYGFHIPICNYNESKPTFEIRRFNNFPIPNSTIADISSPICYLQESPSWGLFARTNKHVRWNMLINNLNACRSTAGSGPVIPWIAAPGYGIRGANTWARVTELDREFQFWQVQMNHMLAMGIDNFMVWNPIPRYNANAVVADRMMDEWLGSNRFAPTQLIPNLPEIPLDADYIETNGVITTYEEFLEMMNLTE